MKKQPPSLSFYAWLYYHRHNQTVSGFRSPVLIVTGKPEMISCIQTGNTLNGTWGSGTSSTGGGKWVMTKK